VKSAVKSSVKSSTVEPTASEASMKATAVEAASAKAAAVTTAAAVTATTLEAFGFRTQGVERLRDGHQICWAHVGRSVERRREYIDWATGRCRFARPIAVAGTAV
jgi:hypothetical protein